MRSRPRTSAGLVVVLLIALAAAAAIRTPKRAEAPKPCGRMRPATIGGSLVIGCLRAAPERP